MDRSNGAKCPGPLIARGLKLSGPIPRNKSKEMHHFKVMHCGALPSKSHLKELHVLQLSKSRTDCCLAMA